MNTRVEYEQDKYDLWEITRTGMPSLNLRGQTITVKLPRIILKVVKNSGRL